MTWRLVAASVKGSSHAAGDLPCQDSNWASPSEGQDANPVLCAFVADGAGSATRGGEGAELAMAAAAKFLKGRLAQEHFTADEAVLVACLEAVRNKISQVAEAECLTSRDYACTFLGAVSTASESALIQIGDGGIVVDVGQGLDMPIIPMSGEYANMTYFVTDEDALARIQTRSFSAALQRLAIFTDGIQRLAVNMSTNAPHSPFFQRFFEVLSHASVEEEDKLHEALHVFLSSGPVNERTDDDRTLVLASIASA